MVLVVVGMASSQERRSELEDMAHVWIFGSRRNNVKAIDNSLKKTFPGFWR
jgi:hypothetical protein